MAHSDELKTNTINEKFEPKEIPPLEKGHTKEIPAVKPDVVHIENSSRSAFEARVRSLQEGSEQKSDSEGKETNREGLTDEEKAKVKEAHPDWADEIIDAIGSWEEYEIYDKAGLHCEYINGKPCLIRNDIDMEQKDHKGRTNRERIEQDLSPLGKDGRPIELHHIGQKPDSPLAELTFQEHHSDGNFNILHEKKETEVHTKENENKWADERSEHWKAREQQS